jgi:hypothetical protein
MISDLDEYIEYAGKTEEISNFDMTISKYKNELIILKNNKATVLENISQKKELISKLKLKSSNSLEDSDRDNKLKNMQSQVNDFQEKTNLLDSQLSQKEEIIHHFEKEKDELIKKSLLNLHFKIKKDCEKVSEEHDHYVDLYTKARAEKHALERKLVNIKMIVSQEYGLRLN